MERRTTECPTRKTPDVTYLVTKADAVADDQEVEGFVSVMNGIAYKCRTMGYGQGWRNEIMVNLTVASYMLGLDPEQVLDDFVSTDLIDCSDDDEDPYDRATRVLDYKRRFSWDWMIDAGWWRQVGETAVDEGAYLPVRFEIAS